MLRKYKYTWLILLLIASLQAAGQYVIDTVCFGNVGHYRVDGETGSSYTWKITDPSGNVVTLTGNADTVEITWNMMPGIYKLSTIQHSAVTGCNGLIEIGDVEVRNQLIPVFGPIGPLCQNSTPPLLPAVSENGVSGTWVPASINTAVIGKETYTFIPDSNQCAVGTSIEIEITRQTLPLFSSLGPLCLNSPSSALPTTSSNGITGVWVLSATNTMSIGITNYTFTPSPGQCGVVVTMGILVTDKITPTFPSIGVLCQNSYPPVLPDTSVNGITGTWEPAKVNTGEAGIVEYKFTPDPSQCGSEVTIAVEVTGKIISSFTSVGPLCLNSTPPALSPMSMNGIPGKWSPDSIRTTVAGSTTYTFTPDTGQCAEPVAMSVTISDKVTPEFEAIGSLCINSVAPVLPLSSANGIHGYWTPTVISTKTAGETDYIFTPDPGSCTSTVTKTITVLPKVVPVFDPIGDLHQNELVPVLPATSLNGVTGKWNPDRINTSGPGTTTYTFTPEGGQCYSVVTVDVTVLAPIVPMISISADQNPICKRQPVKFTATLENSGRNPVFIWMKNGNHVGLNQDTYTDYTLADSDVVSCNLISYIKDVGKVTTKSAEIKMTVYITKAAFTITENINVSNGDILLTNNSTGADQYHWDFGNGQTSSEENPSVTFSENGTYIILLTALNSLNCIDTVSHKYDMSFKGLYIPNAFAPGATTTLGSVFKPSGIGLKKFRVEVYDNWGHLLWSSSALDLQGAPTESWDGTYDGKPMPQGTYLWIAHAVFFDDTPWKGSDNGTGQGSEMGTVLLIR